MRSMAHGPVAAASRSIVLLTSGLFGGLLAFATPAAAATCTWQGDGADARWSVSRNWTGCPAPANGDTLLFPAGAAAHATNDIEGLTISAIHITGDAAGASYLIDGVGVTLTDEVSALTGYGVDGNLSTLALPIALTSGGSLRINLISARALTISGRITDAGDGTIVKLGGGTVMLANAANDWSRLDITDGTVVQQVAGALPARARVDLTVASARLLLNGLDTTIHELHAGSGFEDGSYGQVVLGSRTLTMTGNAQFSGLIVGSGQIVKSGAGTARLAGPFVQSFSGTVRVDGGTLSLGRGAVTSTIGRAIVNGGTLRVTQPDTLSSTAAVTVRADGLFALAAAADTTIGSLDGDGRVTLDVTTLTVGTNNSSTTFAGTIGGFGGGLSRLALRKLGAGTLTLSGANTYDGATRIEAGTIAVNGSLATGGFSTVELFGGTLAGRGTIGTIYAPVGSGGAVSPGTSPGVLTATSVTLSGSFIVELNGASPGDGYDQLRTSGATLSGTLHVSRGFSPPSGAQFDILTVPSPFGTVTGGFAGLPEGAEITIDGQRFAISYHRGVTLTALEGAPELSIDAVTIVEGDGGTTGARFTVTLSRPLPETLTVQYTTVADTAEAPDDYTAQSGSLVFLPGMTTRTIIVPVLGDRRVEPDETFLVRLFGLAASGGREIAVLTHAEGRGTIETDDMSRTYYLSEGATGAFFDEDILIANPNDTVAPVTLTFLTETGEQVTVRRQVGARSHATVHVDLLPGLEAVTASAQITSESGMPLLVERTMFWDSTAYAGHTGSAIERPSREWLFAEGSQGFFDTFVLVANPQATATDVTFTFLLEGGGSVVVTRRVPATARLTLPAGEVPELSGRSFGVTVQATQPIMAERAMYFGATAARPWSGGTESAGVTSAATHWFLAEGATGAFFDTFVLLGNPQDAPANVDLTFLLDSGPPVTVRKVVPAHGRQTINIEAEADARLRDAVVSTVVRSDRPIVAERSMYWAGSPWREAHNSFGLVDLATRWGLAEGRVGGALGFHTYILLANPQADEAQVTVTYLREEGEPLVRQYNVPPTSRFTIDVNAIVPEMRDESFGAVIEVTNGVAIAAERSMYWGTRGAAWTGGTNATGLRLP